MNNFFSHLYYTHRQWHNLHGYCAL